MRFQHTSRRTLLLPAAVTVIGLLLAGCSSSPASHSTAPSSSSPSAVSQIKANWTAFFASGTPTSKRVSLLENGSQFAPVIAAQSKSQLASTASATVSSVKVVSPTKADVTYTINVGGSPALSNQKGVAVHQNGTWKVGDASFCALLTLENSGKTTGLPAACQSAT